MYLQALLSQALRTLGHPHGGRELDPLLVRDGGAVARDRARARLPEPSRRGREEAVRRGVGPQGPRRQDRRPARPADGRRRRPRSPSATPSSRPRSAGASRRQIAVAAIRYFMLKFSRGKLIVFDIEEALSFEGETGPYLQYAVVRANNIFHKLQEREGLTEADVARGARRDAAPTSSTATSRTRPLGAGARGLAARRGRRAGRAVARVLGAGQVRVRARAAVQRVLSSLSDPERGAAPTGSAGAPPGVAYFRRS